MFRAWSLWGGAKHKVVRLKSTTVIVNSNLSWGPRGKGVRKVLLSTEVILRKPKEGSIYGY